MLLVPLRFISGQFPVHFRLNFRSKLVSLKKCYCLSGFGFGENDGVDHAGAGDQGSAVVLKAVLQCCYC